MRISKSVGLNLSVYQLYVHFMIKMYEVIELEISGEQRSLASFCCHNSTQALPLEVTQGAACDIDRVRPRTHWQPLSLLLRRGWLLDPGGQKEALLVCPSKRERSQHRAVRHLGSPLHSPVLEEAGDTFAWLLSCPDLKGQPCSSVRFAEG